MRTPKEGGVFRWRLGCAEVRLVLEALPAHRSHLLEHGPGDSPGRNAAPPPRYMLRCRRWAGPGISLSLPRC